MKRMKKLLAILLAVMMMASLVTTAFAADDGKVDITINSAIEGATYKAYKILNAEDLGDGKFAYSLNPAYTSVLATALGVTTTDDASTTLVNEQEVAIIDAIKVLDTDGIRAFADKVYNAVKSASADATATGTSEKKAVFENVDQGYWLIAETGTIPDDTSYSLVMLDTAGDETSYAVTPKRDSVTVDKVIVDGTADNATDAQIGDAVEFEITSKLPADLGSYDLTKYVFTITDTLSSGLTAPAAKDVTVSGVGTDEYDVSVSGQVITISLKNLDKEDAGADITVTYSAILNSAALSTDEESNTVKLTYSNNPYETDTEDTPEVEVFVYDFKIDITKVDGADNTKTLEGAKFALKNSEGKYFAQDATTKVVSWVDSVDSATTVTTTSDGKAAFEGLDVGTYALEELEAPTGYNKLLGDVSVTIAAEYGTDGSLKDEKVLVATAEIKNNAGIELPSTGGIGTTIFTIAGSVLVIAAIVLLITKKRMSAE